MKDERLMYEGEGSIRVAPFSAEFAPIERLAELYRAPETIRALFAALSNAPRGGNRGGHRGQPGLAR